MDTCGCQLGRADLLPGSLSVGGNLPYSAGWKRPGAEGTVGGWAELLLLQPLIILFSAPHGTLACGGLCCHPFLSLPGVSWI